MTVAVKLMRARLEVLLYFLKGNAKASFYDLAKEPVMTRWLETRIKKEAWGERKTKDSICSLRQIKLLRKRSSDKFLHS